MADKVLIELLIEQKKAIQELAKLNSNLKGTAQEAKKTGRAASGAFSVFAGTLASTAITKGISLVTNGFKSLFRTFVTDGIKAAQVQEDAINSLNIALKASGIFSQKTSEDFQKFASSLQETTKFGDEVILQNIALIQSLGQLDEKGLKQATKATLDLASALKIDLNSASTLVGKAASGNISAFTRFGLTIQKGKTDAETFANAINTINRQFGGAAAAQVKTFSGAVAQTSNVFGDLQETFGQIVTENPAVISAIGDFKNILLEVQKTVIDNKEEIGEFLDKAGESFVALTKAAVAATPEILKVIGVLGEFAAFAVKGGIGEQIADNEEQAKIKKATEEIGRLQVKLESLQDELYKKRAGTGTFFDNLFGAKDPEKGIKFVLAQIEKQQAIIDALSLQEVSNLEDKESKKLKVVSDSSELLKQKKIEEFDFLKSLTAAYNEEDAENKLALEEYEKVKSDERFASIEENLGRERALKLVSDVKALEDAKNIEGAKAAIRKASDDAQKSSLASLFLFEKNTNAGRAANFKSTLTSISTLQASSNKELFFIGKAAAIATATIDGIAGVQKAWALGPIIGPPLAALVGIATAVNLAKIASQQPPSFEQGGIVGGSSFTGDRIRANVNSGELILNQAQQDRVAEKMGGGDIVIQIDGREIARAVRTQVKQGYALA